MLSQDNYTAYDYAIRNGKFECANYLRDYNYKYERYEMNDDNCIGLEDISMAINTITNSNNMVQRFLKAYQKSIDEDVIDFDLIVELTYAIHRSNGNDAILIFLSGYEEIFTLKNRLEHDKRFEVNSYAIFTLHSQMKVDDQKKVFNVLNNKRKIILSTNISETSITIDDVMYVIDCGKVKEKYYDVVSGCSTDIFNENFIPMPILIFTNIIQHFLNGFLFVVLKYYVIENCMDITIKCQTTNGASWTSKKRNLFSFIF